MKTAIVLYPQDLKILKLTEDQINGKSSFVSDLLDIGYFHPKEYKVVAKRIIDGALIVESVR